MRIKHILLIILVILISGISTFIMTRQAYSRKNNNIEVRFSDASLKFGRVLLDLKHALLFKNSKGQVGYVYFTAFDDETADYTIEIFEKVNSTVKKVLERQGTLRMGEDGQFINVGKPNVIGWFYPNAIYFSGSGLDYVATISVDLIYPIRKGKWDKIKWIKVMHVSA